MKITVFDVASGRILRLVECPKDSVAKQIRPGEGFLEGHHDDATHRFVDGRIEKLPPRPSEHCLFDYATGVWVDQRTAEEQWSLIRSERNRLLRDSDWTDALSARARLGDAAYGLWQAYRQALRDITTQTDPFNIVWPAPPA